MDIISTYHSKIQACFFVNLEKSEFPPPTFKSRSTVVHRPIFIQVTPLYWQSTALTYQWFNYHKWIRGFERKEKTYAIVQFFDDFGPFFNTQNHFFSYIATESAKTIFNILVHLLSINVWQCLWLALDSAENKGPTIYYKAFSEISAAILDAILDCRKRTTIWHVHPIFSDTSDIYLQNGTKIRCHAFLHTGRYKSGWFL